MIVDSLELTLDSLSKAYRTKPTAEERDAFSQIEQVARAWVRAARVSIGERELRRGSFARQEFARFASGECPDLA